MRKRKLRKTKIWKQVPTKASHPIGTKQGKKGYARKIKHKKRIESE
jgi:hypothetical protein